MLPLKGLSTKNVIISGKLQGKYFKEIRISSFDYILQRDTVLATTTVKNDSTFTFSLVLEKPTTAQFLNAGIFITPGDSVFLISDGQSYILSSSGKNSGNYLFLSEFRKKFRTKAVVFLDEHKKNLLTFKSLLQDDLAIKRQFLVEYDSPISQSFRSYAAMEINYAYVDKLLFPLRIYIPFNEAPDGYLDVEAKDFDEKTYFNGIYAKALYQFVDVKNMDKKISSTEKIIRHFKMAQKEFQGVNKEIILLLSLKEYYHRNIKDTGCNSKLRSLISQNVSN